MRIEQEIDTLSHQVLTTRKADGSVINDNTTSTAIVSRNFTRSDIVRNPPDAHGFRHPSPYLATLQEYSPPMVSGKREHVHRFPSSQFLMDINGVAMSFHSIFGNLLLDYSDWENSLKSQALRSVKDQRVNLSMTLAFLPQTLRMIRGRFDTISAVLTAAKRGDWRTVGRQLDINPKSSSSFYLEVLFGWLQLLRDTQGIVEELHRKCNKPHVSYIYGRARREQHNSPLVKIAEPRHWEKPGVYRFDGLQRVDHRMVLIYRGETALLTRLSQLGLMNPAELLWDLVPWSWVVNMGLSIGDFVSTLDATVGLTYLGGSYTRYSQVSGPISVTALPLPPGNPSFGYWVNKEFSSSPGFFSQMKTERRVINDKVDPFVLKNPFSAPIALTAAVIAATVQKGRSADLKQPPRGSTRSIMGKTRMT